MGVLGAVLSSHGHANNEGKIYQTTGHGLPFRHLVEKLVAGAANEIGIHQLDNGAATAQGIAHTSAHNHSLGNGSVEQAMPRQQFGQPPIDTKGTTPVSVFFTPGRQAIVGHKVLHQRFTEGIPERDGFGPTENGVAVDSRARFASEILKMGDIVTRDKCFPDRGRVQINHRVTKGESAWDECVGPKRKPRGLLVVNGHLECGSDSFFGPRFPRAIGVGRHHATVDQVVHIGGNWIHSRPGIHFFFGPVGGSVGGRVARVSIRLAINQDRAQTRVDDVASRAHRIDDGKWVGAIYGLGVHTLWVDSGTHSRHKVIGHRFADGLAPHAIKIVDDEKHHGESTTVAIIHEGSKLSHRSKIKGLPHLPGACGGVPHTGYNQSRRALDAMEEAGAGG